MDDDPDMIALAKAIDKLKGRFDCIQVFASRFYPGDGPDDGTTAASMGHGNYYARFGQVTKWLKDAEKR